MFTPARIVALAGAAALGALIASLKAFGVEGEPTSDAVSEAGVHALTGGISTAGLLVWGWTAGVAALGGLALRRLDSPDESRFLLAIAVGVLCLGLDDALLFHEDLVPNQLGLSEAVVFALMAVVALALGFHFRTLVGESDLVLLCSAAACFAVATAVDLLGAWSIAGEDWIGYAGLAALATWVVDTSLCLVLRARVAQ